MTTKITWWEFSDLIDHLMSRPDIWLQSDENEHLWLLTTASERSALGLLFSPPSDTVHPYRMYTVQAIGMEWADEHVEKYVHWLLHHWTSYNRRLGVEQFLIQELNIDPETAVPSAIALEALDWTQGKVPEPLEPEIQEHLWPKTEVNISPTSPDPFHIGTFLFNGGAGWVKLRLVSGMIRTLLSIRAKTGETVLLEGFTRPTHGRLYDTAAQLGGWTPGVEKHDAAALQPQLEEDAS